MGKPILESLIFIGLILLSTSFLAPRAILYYLKWKRDRRQSQFIVFFVYGLTALFILSAVLMVGLKPFIYSKFPF